MLLFQGQAPTHKLFTNVLRASVRAVHLLVMYCLASFGATVQAQTLPPLTLAQAEAMALSDEPGAEVFLARAAALSEQSIAAVQLPDPKIRVGLANYPIEAGGFSTEGMTHAKVGVRQAFPRGKTRYLSGNRLDKMAAEMALNAQARQREVLMATRHAWLDTLYWVQAEQIIENSRAHFEYLLEVSQSLYSLGVRDQQDVLRAELELSRLDQRLLDIRNDYFQAQARLAQWIGDAAAGPIDTVLPKWQPFPTLEQLQSALSTHPRLQSAEAQTEIKRVEVQLAEQRYKPGWAIDLDYAYRDGLLPNGNSRSDFVSLAVSFDVPLFRKDRQDREFSAAKSQRRAARASYFQLERILHAQLRSHYSRWHELSRSLSLYEDTILNQSKARLQAAVLAYQSGAGDFTDVMRSQIDDLNFRLDVIRLTVDKAKSYAWIANLGGITP